MNIAIIGAGLAGSNILKNLYDNDFIKNNKIYVFEKRDSLGSGFPYEHESDLKMLNIDARYMSMGEDEDGFVKWLDENKEEPVNFENMAPRNYYGEYLEDFFSKYYNLPEVNIIKKEVNDIDIISDNDKTKYIITTDVKENIEFDAVFLSIGHPDYKDPYKLRDNKHYIHNPYPMNKKLTNFSNGDRIGIIGAGSTSLDVFRYILQKYNLEHPFYIFARNSIFNIPHVPIDESRTSCPFSMSEEWIKDQIEKNNGFVPLDNIVELIDNDLKTEGIDFLESHDKIKNVSLELYRELIDEKPQDIALITEYFELFTKYYSRLYGLLTNEDKDRLMRDYDRCLESFRTLTPEKTIEWLLDEIDKGRVVILKGLEDVEELDNSLLVKADEDIEIDYLINTTGFDFDIKTNTKINPFIRNLYNKKIIDPDIDGKFVNIKWPEGSILSKKYGELSNLVMIGMWVFGSHYRANDVRSIKAVSKVMVKKFVERNK